MKRGVRASLNGAEILCRDHRHGESAEEARTMSENQMNPSRLKRGTAHLSLLLIAIVVIASLGATVSAQAPIESTKSGEMPTTGGLRPGPIGLNPIKANSAGVVPVSIQIESAAVDAEVEQLEIVDGKMQDPTGPW